MDVYIYQGEVFCDHCAREEFADLRAEGVAPSDDSDEWPQGPYAYAAGESDSPQYCDGCGVFLENDLTEEGVRYVLDAVARYLSDGRGDRDVIREWVEFYDVTLSELLDRVEARL